MPKFMMGIMANESMRPAAAKAAMVVGPKELTKACTNIIPTEAIPC